MINYLEKYLKYKNKYLKIKKQVGGIKKNHEFVVKGKTITADIPDNFFDNIFTLDIMVDPVTLSDGFTYEHNYVIQWLKNKNTSPQTGAILKNRNIIPNITLKKIIDDFLDETYCNGYYNVDNFLQVYKMDNPVILSDGYSYNYKYAEEWLKDKDLSPTTGEKLLNKNIIPNHTLKNIIEDLLVENNSKKLNEQIGELERLANSGDCCAQYQLGLKYYLGEGLVVKNLKKALDLLKKSSINCESSKKLLNSSDFKESIFEEGRRLYNNKDYSEAAMFWNEAVLLKHADAHAFLSDMLIDGRLYVPIDDCRAFKLASDGVILGSIHSKGVLGRCYIEGIVHRGEHEGEHEGFRLATESANGNSYFGQGIVGVCYKYGIIVPFDRAEAIRLLSLSAEHGYPYAQRELGDMLFRGFGAAQNEEEGLLWLRLAAKQGDREAQFILGEILLDKKKYEDSIRYLKDAANQKDLNALYFLGNIYRYGEGVPQDLGEAERWYKLAVEQRNRGAMNSLGEMYFFGIGVIKNKEEGMRLWRLAVEHGNEDAKVNLGIELLDTKDEAEGVRLITESANHGIARAQYELGRLHYFGEGVPQNLELAVLWYKRAAEQGYPQAQHRLGVLYSNGDGVAQDYTEAERWYSLARAQGFPPDSDNVQSNGSNSSYDFDNVQSNGSYSYSDYDSDF